MSMDIITYRHQAWRKRLKGESGPKGLELTKMDRFVDGTHDIFDVLENHAANNKSMTDFHSRIEMNFERPTYQDKPEILEKFWRKLQNQIKRLKEETQL